MRRSIPTAAGRAEQKPPWRARAAVVDVAPEEASATPATWSFQWGPPAASCSNSLIDSRTHPPKRMSRRWLLPRSTGRALDAIDRLELELSRILFLSPRMAAGCGSAYVFDWLFVSHDAFNGRNARVSTTSRGGSASKAAMCDAAASRVSRRVGRRRRRMSVWATPIDRTRWSIYSKSDVVVRTSS